MLQKGTNSTSERALVLQVEEWSVISKCYNRTLRAMELFRTFKRERMKERLVNSGEIITDKGCRNTAGCVVETSGG
jgi:hypothetical protein